MIVDCPGCGPAATDVRGEPRRARARLPWLALLPATLYALVPKCPLCLVAYLSSFGVTFGIASSTLSVLRALAVASVVLALGFALRHLRVLRTALTHGLHDNSKTVRRAAGVKSAKIFASEP